MQYMMMMSRWKADEQQVYANSTCFRPDAVSSRLVLHVAIYDDNGKEEEFYYTPERNRYAATHIRFAA